MLLSFVDSFFCTWYLNMIDPQIVQVAWRVIFRFEAFKTHVVPNFPSGNLVDSNTSGGKRDEKQARSIQFAVHEGDSSKEVLMEDLN